MGGARDRKETPEEGAWDLAGEALGEHQEGGKAAAEGSRLSHRRPVAVIR